MRCKIFAAAAVAGLVAYGPAWAGQFDGNYQGTSKALSPRCSGANFTFTVKDATLGGTMAGGITSSGVITGTVAPDGSFTGTATSDRGSVPISGKFAGDTAEFTSAVPCGRENGTAKRVP
jgi:hypothetical protein